MEDLIIEQYNTEQINHLIRNRRSVFPKQYSDRKVPREIVEQILENANWAPTHGKTEPWRFIVFCGEGLQKLSDFQAEMYQKFTPPELFQIEKLEKNRTNPLKASHVIAICMKRHEGKIPEIEEIAAVACAVQNMSLTASAYGVGNFWSTGGVTYIKEAKEFFGLGDKDKLLGFFYLGYAKENISDATRSPIQNKTTWII